MGLPALKIEDEGVMEMEARMARLEEKADRAQSDISDLRIEVRGIRSDMKEMDHRLTTKIEDVDKRLTARIEGLDQKLAAKIDAVDVRLSSRIDDVKDSVVSLHLQFKDFESVSAKRETRLLWKLAALIIATMGTTLGVMAKGFGWV